MAIDIRSAIALVSEGCDNSAEASFDATFMEAEFLLSAAVAFFRNEAEAGTIHVYGNKQFRAKKELIPQLEWMHLRIDLSEAKAVPSGGLTIDYNQLCWHDLHFVREEIIAAQPRFKVWIGGESECLSIEAQGVLESECASNEALMLNKKQRDEFIKNEMLALIRKPMTVDKAAERLFEKHKKQFEKIAIKSPSGVKRAYYRK